MLRDSEAHEGVLDNLMKKFLGKEPDLPEEVKAGDSSSISGAYDKIEGLNEGQLRQTYVTTLTNLKQLFCRSTLLNLLRCSEIGHVINKDNLTDPSDQKILFGFLKIIYNDALKA